jgi:hydroxymethylpyrimidine pyrophosphatase-like HAD family hydrolase
MQRVLKGKEKISKVRRSRQLPLTDGGSLISPFSQIFLPMDESVVPDMIDLIEKTFKKVPFKITRALPYIIEIVAEGVDKSAALAFFCAKFNIDPKNVISFGDGENE